MTSQSLSVCKVCRNDHAIGTLDRHLQFSRDRMGGIFVSPLGRYVVRGMGGARGPVDEKRAPVRDPWLEHALGPDLLLEVEVKLVWIFVVPW